uniref:Uncharacterized protein n=1 Tax=Rhizophora mucronata TaxID=61149 RepID=A0A2P2NGJ7_RHIMU
MKTQLPDLKIPRTALKSPHSPIIQPQHRTNRETKFS